MESSLSLAVAQSMAVMVRVRGPDPKGRKMRRHAFYTSDSGTTVLSVSGILLPGNVCVDSCGTSGASGAAYTGSDDLTSHNSSFVITCGSSLQSFLRQGKGPQKDVEMPPELLPGAEIHVLAEESHGDRGDHTVSGSSGTASWHPARLLAVLDIPEANAALQGFLSAQGNNGGLGWDFGWALSPSEPQQEHKQPQVVGASLPATVATRGVKSAVNNHSGFPKGRHHFLASNDTSTLSGVSPADGGSLSAVQVAVLCVELDSSIPSSLNLQKAVKDQQRIQQHYKIPWGLVSSASLMRGERLTVVGSPFGILSPQHFLNSVTVGVVGNRWSPREAVPSLVMADMRCLPGMEGSPVVTGGGALVGMLGRPLRQKATGTEVQLFICSDVLARALRPFKFRLNPPFALSEKPSFYPSQIYEQESNLFEQQRPIGSTTSEPPMSLQMSSTENPSSNFLYHHCKAVEANSRVATVRGTEPSSKNTFFLSNSKAWSSPLEESRCRSVENTRESSGNLGSYNFDCKLDGTEVSRAVEIAYNSVVLITVGDGAWASGIILSQNGLVLTNAHLIEPWRFRKRSSGKESGIDRKTTSMGLESSLQKAENGCISLSNSCSVSSNLISTISPSVTSPNSPQFLRNQHHVRVRISGYQEETSVSLPSYRWCDAEVIFVSHGPLDVAILKLRESLDGLQAIQPEMGIPSAGSTAVVIGHGLFGPRLELQPSVSAGVVARVVMAPSGGTGGGNFFTERRTGTSSMPTHPVLLQTTAAVHAGGSGGAVVNKFGRLIGLVTSNAKHNGWAVLPHLNFSVPTAALSVIFHFAASGGQDSSILSSLDHPDKYLSKVWALVPSPSPPPPTSTFTSPQSDISHSSLKDSLDRVQKMTPEKGLRFAKFLSDSSPGMFGKKTPIGERGEMFVGSSSPFKGFGSSIRPNSNSSSSGNGISRRLSSRL